MKHIKQSVIAIVAVIVCAACSKQSNYVTIDGFAQGTTYHCVVDQIDTTGLRAQIETLFDEVDQSLSVYNDNSRLSRINRGETDTLDRHLVYNIETCHNVSLMSDGAFDITIKPVTAAWGFAGKGEVESPNIDSLMQFVGYKRIAIVDGRLMREDPRMQLDLNTSAQGYTADLLGQLMEVRGTQNYLVEIGGEMFCHGVNSKGEAWSVGVDKPIEGNFTPGEQLQTIVKLSSGEGLATSGNYRKFRVDASGRKVSHIVDARTGYSVPSNLLSATVIAPNATLADVYGTMFMIIGLDASRKFLAEHPQLKGYLVYSGEGGKYETFSTPNLTTISVE